MCVINFNRILMKLQFVVNYVYCFFMNVASTISEEGYAVKTGKDLLLINGVSSVRICAGFTILSNCFSVVCVRFLTVGEIGA